MLCGMQSLAGQGRMFMEWLAEAMGVVLKRRESKVPEYEKKEEELRREVKVEEERKEREQLEQLKKEEEYINHSYIRAQQDELWA